MKLISQVLMIPAFLLFASIGFSQSLENSFSLTPDPVSNKIERVVQHDLQDLVELFQTDKTERNNKPNGNYFIDSSGFHRVRIEYVTSARKKEEYQPVKEGQDES